MSYRLVFEIPGLPRMSNASGRSRSWRATHNAARRWKHEVILVTRSHRPPAPLERARLTLTRFSSVEPDADGLVIGFKPVIDGLVKAGILVNDRMSNIGMPTYRWAKALPGKGKIQVVVEEIDGAADDLPNAALASYGQVFK